MVDTIEDGIMGSINRNEKDTECQKKLCSKKNFLFKDP